MKRINYNKKVITGKETHLILSLEAYKALNTQKKKLNIKSTTALIEFLLLNAANHNTHIPHNVEDTLPIKNQKVFAYITNLINFNKKLYLDINATFSNINQIAYRLNLANLNNTTDSIDFTQLHQEIIQTLAQNREELLDLKVIMKNLIKILKNHEKTLAHIPKQAKGERK